MVKIEKPIMLVVVLALILGGILVIESLSPDRVSTSDADIDISDNTSDRVQQKEGEYRKAKRILNPAGYINADNVSIEENIGEKVILVDFWTYSCINCQRTLPYLNAWHHKYSDDGLLIIGVHSPEFEFEKDRDNVQEAVNRFNVAYPVVLDNSFSTWSAYDNRYWPQKYIIDVDGFIRYEHIGEGSYRETEDKIQELLRERAEVLGEEVSFDEGYVDPEAKRADFNQIETPEIYFGASRNSRYLANGDGGTTGTQALEVPDSLRDDDLYLGGTWSFQDEYAEAVENGSRIVLSYKAKEVNMVLDADQDTDLVVTIDGEPLGDNAGEDVVNRGGESIVTVNEERLYNIVSDDSYSRHRLEITTEEGLEAFTFTFG